MSDMFGFAPVRADWSRAQTKGKRICPMSYVPVDRAPTPTFAPNASRVHTLTMTREEFKKILAESGQTLEEFDAHL